MLVVRGADRSEKGLAPTTRDARPLVPITDDGARALVRPGESRVQVELVRVELRELGVLRIEYPGGSANGQKGQQGSDGVPQCQAIVLGVGSCLDPNDTAFL
jgi:hypothetical protein